MKAFFCGIWLRSKRVEVWAAIIFFMCLCSPSIGSAQVADVPVYGVFEVSLTTSSAHANPYTDVSLTGTFQGPTQQIIIEGFWDGGGTWKLRMAPTEAGTWTLVQVSSNDAELNHQQEGLTFAAHTPTADEIKDNEVLRHGFVTINPAYPHTFMHKDGTPFFFLGDTRWCGKSFCGTIFQDGLFQQMVDARAAQGFTVFSVAHLALYSSVGNEGGAPFIGSHTNNVLNPGFFQWVDKRIDYMTRKGIRPMLLLGAPDGGLTSNTDWLERMQRYLIARYAAYDVIWFGVKEYEEWGSSAAIDAIGNAIASYDPYRHPASTHTTNSTNEIGGKAWLSFNALQRGGGSNGAPSQSGVSLVISDYQNFEKPVVQTEAFYEGAPGSPNYFSDPSVLLNGLWAIQLHGGWNAGYQLVTQGIDQYLQQMNNTSAAYHTHLKSFFVDRTEFWKLVPNNGIVVAGTAWAAAQPGKEYVLFLKNGGAVDVDLSAASGSLPFEWYDPTKGTFTGASVIAGGGIRSFTAPGSGSWVLHIGGSGSGGSTDTSPPMPPKNLKVADS
ncbi:MAG: DUF4038 domain-containing protein [Nitrospirae bacterium]|nr:MAG: DUF4038 domain-containing protein [Nitrospirota bacterium]